MQSRELSPGAGAAAAAGVGHSLEVAAAPTGSTSKAATVCPRTRARALDGAGSGLHPGVLPVLPVF